MGFAFDMAARFCILLEVFMGAASSVAQMAIYEQTCQDRFQHHAIHRHRWLAFGYFFIFGVAFDMAG